MMDVDRGRRCNIEDQGFKYVVLRATGVVLIVNYESFNRPH